MEVLAAHGTEEVLPCLSRVEKALSKGLHAAGYLSYEAAAAFDPALAAHPPLESLPLAMFGVYDKVETIPLSSFDRREDAVPFHADWVSGVGRTEYDEAIARIHSLIAAGDTYQINYTFPMTAPFDGDAAAWFLELCARQRTDHRAWLNLGDHQVLSLSPELFFRLDGSLLETRPMKGTRARGRWPEEDARARAALYESVKDRAENVMIVDLLRNDMGRISEVGSVSVPRLFDVERYGTVWQMTSTVQARTKAGLSEIFAALFPSGSVTGAPKIRSMQIIRECEPEPRGVYCGAVGWCGPGRRAEFNVAIRTLLLHRPSGRVRYAVGGGITWDSTARGEYEECLLKAAFLGREEPPFDLLESLRWDGASFYLLREHQERLAASAAYFERPFDAAAMRAALDDAVRDWGGTPAKVRLLLFADGAVSATAGPLPETRPVVLRWASAPVDDRDRFLFHKTTRRQVYDDALAERGAADDVLLWNRRGEVTESCFANVVVNRDGTWFTPPVGCGLLAGTLRGRLLESGKVQEAVVTRNDVHRAGEVALINSVRGWIPVARISE